MSNELEKERLRKQQYLIDAIQKQNYNTKAFEDFLTSKKDNGQNIEVWTFAELQDVSRRFFLVGVLTLVCIFAVGLRVYAHSGQAGVREGENSGPIRATSFISKR
jgi:hypothetical protein